MATHIQNTRDPDLNLRFFSIADAFVKGLRPDEKLLLGAANLSEALLQDAVELDQKYRGKSNSRKAAQKLRSLVDGINQYGAALDVISNSSSLVLCPVWGSMRIILHLATEYGEYFDKLTTMLERIGRDLASLRRYPKLYPNNQRLKDEMVRVYQIIFEFCAKARHVFWKGGEGDRKYLSKITPVGLRTLSKLVWKPFKRQFGDLQEQLYEAMDAIKQEVALAENEESSLERRRAQEERELQALRWEAEYTHIEEEKQQRIEALAEREAQLARWNETRQAHRTLENLVTDQEREKIEMWLSPADCNANHNVALRLRHQRTGLWFLSGDVFQRWSMTRNTLLWLHAKPGAGKTVLMASAVDHLKQTRSQQQGLAYFYCDYKDKAKQQPSAIISTILMQLAKQNNEVLNKLRAFFLEQQKDSRTASPGFDELRSNFSSFVVDAFEEVIIVVDAVDECTDRRCIMYGLQSIVETTPSAKVLVSSREESQIVDAFQEWSFSGKRDARIKESDVADDIESFVKAEVTTRIRAKKLKLRDGSLKKTIVEALVKGADGMFQWVKCQIDTFCTMRSDKAIKEALTRLPKTLEEVYIEILRRVERDQENDIPRIQKLLRWLVRGTRSMSLDELSECTGIDLKHDTQNYDDVDIITDPKDILEMCSSLVTVSDDKAHVSLAHYTVKEFLTSAQTHKLLPAFHVGDMDVEAELAKTCLTYLCFIDFANGPVGTRCELDGLLESHKFLDYAAMAWAKHAHRTNQDDELFDLIMRLFQIQDEDQDNYHLWLQVFMYRKAARQYTPPKYVPPFYFAAAFGLPRILTALKDRRVEEATPQDDRDPIGAAAFEGYNDILQILLDGMNKSDKAALAKYLYTAASKGHTESVQLLLKQGVSVDSYGGEHGTALSVASLHGQSATVETLLEEGANTKVVDERFAEQRGSFTDDEVGTPLAAACEKAHEKTVKALLDHGASPNGRGGWFSHPLMSAIIGRNNVIITLLLEKGANVNAQGGRHVCPLMCAAYLGNLKVVQELIDRGAKVNDENDKGADALHSASVAGHLEVVRLLLESGADVNAKGGKHKNALNAASAEGFPSIVKELLAAGADPRSFDEQYGNAIQAASHGGHDDVVEILVTAGIDLNHRGGSQRGTALVCASASGRLSTVELLFEHGIPQGPTQDIANAMVAASKNRYQDTVKTLLEKGGNINYNGRLTTLGSELNPLSAACQKGDERLVEFLLARGADANFPCPTNGTALLAALSVPTRRCSLDVINRLLVAGAQIDTLPESGLHGNALAAAVAQKNQAALSLLIESGANINLANGNKESPLMIAAIEESGAFLDVLLSKGADPNFLIKVVGDRNDDGIVSALEAAAAADCDSNVRKLIASGASISHERSDTIFKDVLQVSSYYGQVKTIEALLRLGADPNNCGGKWGTSLQAAASQGYCEVIKVLIREGAKVNQSGIGKYGNALTAAVWKGSIDAVKLLLEHGADPNLAAGKGYDHQYALHAACLKWGEVEEPALVKMLVEAGANLSLEGGRFWTPLQAAAAGCLGEPSTMKYLIDQGANIHVVGGVSGTALSACYHEGYYLCTDLLYEAGASANLKGGHWRHPRGAALSGACQTMVTYLLKYYAADVNQDCGMGGSPLQYSIAWRGETQLPDLFLQYGADVHCEFGAFGTALAAATFRKREKLMKDLIDNHGADVNQLTKSPAGAAIMTACRIGWNDGLEILASRGANLDIVAGRWGGACSTAAYNGHLETIQWLLDKGVDPNNPGNIRFGHPLHSAAIARGKNFESMRLLVRSGASVHAQSGVFRHALQAAALKSPSKAVLLLIHKGANVNATGGRYHTALQAACAAGNEKVVKLLLRHGAEVNACGGRYGSPLQAACVFGKTSIVRTLLRAGADVDAEGGFYGTSIQAAAAKNRSDIVDVLLREAQPRLTSIDRKLNHVGIKHLDRADQLLRNTSEPSPSTEAEQQPGEEEAEPSLDELLGLTDSKHGAAEDRRPETVRHASTGLTAPMLASKLRNVHILTSAVQEMKATANAKTMRELGFGDDIPPTAWLEWYRGQD